MSAIGRTLRTDVQGRLRPAPDSGPRHLLGQRLMRRRADTCAQRLPGERTARALTRQQPRLDPPLSGPGILDVALVQSPGFHSADDRLDHGNVPVNGPIADQQRVASRLECRDCRPFD